MRKPVRALRPWSFRGTKRTRTRCLGPRPAESHCGVATKQEHVMKPFPATARAGSALALLALSSCYYVGPGYYPYGYYPAVPAVSTQHEVPAQGYGLSNGADAQNIPPASP